MKSERMLKAAVTLLVSVVGFVLLAGPSCPFGGSNDEQPAYTAPVQPVSVVPKELEVEKLVLTDSGGNPRASLESFSDGGVTLGFFDDKGKERSTMGLEADGTPIYIMYDESDMERARLFLDEQGSPTMDMLDRQGEIRTSVQLGGKGQPAFYLYDDSGNAKASLYLNDKGDPIMTYVDSKGNEVTVVPQKEVKQAAAAPASRPSRPAPTTTSAPRPTTKSTNGEMVVVVVKGSNRYHRLDCPRIRKAKHAEKRRIFLQDAVASGRIPCPDCKPPRLN